MVSSERARSDLLNSTLFSINYIYFFICEIHFLSEKMKKNEDFLAIFSEIFSDDYIGKIMKKKSNKTYLVFIQKRFEANGK